jgi:hypothetical protein
MTTAVGNRDVDTPKTDAPREQQIDAGLHRARSTTFFAKASSSSSREHRLLFLFFMRIYPLFLPIIPRIKATLGVGPE